MGTYSALIDRWVRGGTVPIAELVGFRLTDCTDGVATIACEASQRHHNQAGTVHGGVLCVLAEACMGVAVAAGLADDELLATTQINVVYHRPLVSGPVQAIGRTVNRGRSSAYATCEIVDAERKLLASATSTWSIRKTPTGIHP